MFFVYIIRSKIRSRYYTGSTEDLEERLRQHNAGKVKSTKAYRPWDIAYTETFERREDAYARERQIKAYKGGEAFRKLLGK